MKLSLFATATNAYIRGDLWDGATACYKDLADEVVVVEGGNTESDFYLMENMKVFKYIWPKEFSWPFIGEQFQRGYEACTGDWCIRADLDFIFHEEDFATLRKAIEDNLEAPALSLYKYQFILPDRYNLKSRLVIAVNKGKYGDRIKFDSGGDLCQPSLDGKEIKPDSVPEAKVPIYNYEHLIKTEDQSREDVERMDRAYHRHFGKWLYSDNGEGAFEGWLKMMVGRFERPSEHIRLEDHPRYIQETIKNLTPEQFGHSGWGRLEPNDYV